ncbi:hypothetical protein [Neolewinella sp.]|uniref:hypothetical protein n=1 Tax=Neolewinella sp. TaxID=2993543 RepID=UPI003B52588B
MPTPTKSNQIQPAQVYQQLVLPALAPCAKGDSRRKNASYTALDALKSGYAIFHLKAPSLFGFRPKLAIEKQNLHSVYGIDRIPSDNGLRDILDRLTAQDLNEGFHRVLPFLESQQVAPTYRYWNEHYVVSVDGVQHQCSNKVKCSYCLERRHQNGTVSYSHSMLSGALVCPKQRPVFVVDNEPIVRQDGETKNDCERSAAKRFFARQATVNSDRSMVYVLDTLYACAPIVTLITQSSPQWKYLINAKESGSKYLFEQFDELNARGKVRWKMKRRKGGSYELGYTNDVALNKSNEGMRVNVLYCRVKEASDKEVVFSYLTNIELHHSNLMAVLEMGRSRWKIENEVFNTLKNQEYNYGHNYDHGKENLATNFAYLMMLAFTADQLLECCNRAFGRVLKKLRTRIKLWEVQRSVMLTTVMDNLDEVWRKMLEMCGLRVMQI